LEAGYRSGLQRYAGSVSRSALKSIFRSFRGSKLSHRELWTLTMEAWRLIMEPWRAFKSVVADSHHFDMDQDPDPDPRLSERLDPDPHLSKKTGSGSGYALR
jgi:hypothetical protein